MQFVRSSPEYSYAFEDIHSLSTRFVSVLLLSANVRVWSAPVVNGRQHSYIYNKYWLLINKSNNWLFDLVLVWRNQWSNWHYIYEWIYIYTYIKIYIKNTFVCLCSKSFLLCLSVKPVLLERHQYKREKSKWRHHPFPPCISLSSV